ncbi:MAG: CusA/CzcA family heavy metal efflux RND transporter [Gemmatimonadaceae bacterium]|nr:CusA/CzcA family heavy metal efflux RND transporter [Gemmatimonadaceae bacterium]
MLDAVIHFSIRRKLIIGLMTLALIGWGSYSLTRLPIDAVPDITDNQVMVITQAPRLAAQEVEQLVTFPVEQGMVSIPGIQDMRSFSRFGLSIVTIVFGEEVDLYWARQQVAERLAVASKDIPESIGTPEMAPVTTGLGEIYQYEIHAAKGYEAKYSPTDLRTIQDWIIKRQLLGTPGVAEVSGFGGVVKQYEIAVDPDKMRSLGVTIADIFTALQDNNQNTGGAYIDRNASAYFIRSEGFVKTIDDIARIVVTSPANGTPLLIRDVATVRLGHGVRYGAATRNGEGEVVTGIVMMLKGANSSQVITAVKDRIEQIKTTLPEGVVIGAFLDRKKLVDNAIGTVTTNLAEGALIVVFVLVLFLGNWRGGLVVASVIPLSMLFAVSLMNLFGVSGNLMSLGAIDFGLIVDGAVIIVEAILHRMSHLGDGETPSQLTAGQMDDEVYESTRRIRTSAAFGEMIILIVYLPLLALIGVEGKMFRPMAQTVSFAILGAFLLSLTYVPMMSALVLSKKTSHVPNFSDRMMGVFQRLYRPSIEAALRHRLPVVGGAVALFVVALVLFTRMGSEFIPQLDEGDFAVETRVPVGSSIQQMIDVSQKAQTIIRSNFPEVTQVVNKIGSGEIPTDPMPIEAGDMMVILKPRKEWTSGETREELVERMQSALSVIPNATFSFQQPIQMRFNELLTGAKQDVVIKLYGEDLNVLSDLAREVGRKIGGIDGVEDLYVEQITGLPQIKIALDRDKIARYGVSVAAVNRAIETGFAGVSAGKVYENERRFDLVVRLDSARRADITDVEQLNIGTPSGQQLPLRELATISYEPGPVQIQRDNAKRRITVGFNVRSRDVKSIVGDIQRTIREQITFPAGYYESYGGQFKNLEEANARLSIAVPVALFLILVLLFFTFGSIGQSLLIFTAIPLSAIGGVLALLVRGMPFSISAGVGFVALFGVAVLNGIVLIAEFNRLRREGVADIHERIVRGTEVRLRPVLMTALVASLGFLPMALSNSSGAEVQRPLATVVIGGLISATALTLIVLPVLYSFFSGDRPPRGPRTPVVAGGGVIAAVLALLVVPTWALRAQSAPVRTLTLQQAIDEALTRNGDVRVAQSGVNVQRALAKGAVSLPRTELNYTHGQFNTPGVNDALFGVSQRVDFPTLYGAQARLAREQVRSSESAVVIARNTVTTQVRRAYLQLQYIEARQLVLTSQDSVFREVDRASRARLEAGEGTRLESVASATRALRVRNTLEQNRADGAIALSQLQQLLRTTDSIRLADLRLVPAALPATIDTARLSGNPELARLEQEVRVSNRATSVERQRLLPDLLLGYSAVTFRGGSSTLGTPPTDGASKRVPYYSLGIGIPLVTGATRARVSAARIAEDIAQTQLEWATLQARSEVKRLLQERDKLQQSLRYFEQQALPQATLIIGNSDVAFRAGDISYVEHLQNLTLASDIQLESLDAIYRFNSTVIEIAARLGIH